MLCQFQKYSDVLLIKQNRAQLPRKIFVNEDYPAEIQDRRRVLRPIFNAARRNTKYQGKCRLVDDRLIILGQAYTAAPIRNLDKLPDDLNPRKLAEREDDETIAFFTRASPFSNFHDAPFHKNGKNYRCVEQYIQAGKAELFDDDRAYNKILNATSPFDMKKEGNHVKNYADHIWKQNAERIAFEGCVAKFEQNELLKEILLNTDCKEILEASKDPFWGVGLSIDDKNILNKEARQGENKLGNILMRVRELLRKQTVTTE